MLKVAHKKVRLQATFFVRLVRSLINLLFSTNQIEETDKQTKSRWRVVDHSHMAILSIWKTIYDCLLRLYVLPTGTTTAATATTANDATATTVLHT